MNAYERAQDRLSRNDYVSTQAPAHPQLVRASYRFAATRMAETRDDTPDDYWSVIWNFSGTWAKAEVWLPLLFIFATFVLTGLVRHTTRFSEMGPTAAVATAPTGETPNGVDSDGTQALEAAGGTMWFHFSNAAAGATSDMLLACAFLFLVVALELEDTDRFFQPVMGPGQRSLVGRSVSGHPWDLWWYTIFFLVVYLIYIVFLESGLITSAAAYGFIAACGLFAFLWTGVRAQRYRARIRTNLQLLAGTLDDSNWS